MMLGGLEVGLPLARVVGVAGCAFDLIEQLTSNVMNSSTKSLSFPMIYSLRCRYTPKVAAGQSLPNQCRSVPNFVVG